MHKKNHRNVGYFGVLLSVSALALMPADRFYVAAPGFACVVMVLWLWITLWDRDRKIPFFDLGMICALATLVYTVYPLVNYWVDGLQFGPLSDNRLQTYSISPAQLGLFHLRHVLYLFSFVVFYLVFRVGGTIELGIVNSPSRSAQRVIVLLFLLLTAYFLLLQLMTGVNYNPSYEPEAYAKYLAAFSSVPLVLLQISGKLAGILFIVKLALLFIVVSRFREKKWRTILFVWVAAEIFNAFLIKGGRTGLVLFLMAAGLYYHRMIRPLSMKFLITSGVSLFVLFIFLGFFRTVVDLAALRTGLSQTEAGIFSAGNEFQALLGTAYDVLQRKEDGAYLPWYLYINDIITILPPQQLMPFEKVPAAEWYLREIGESGSGIGYMWGVVSQSIIGLDWIELALRGGILGYILSRIHHFYVKHQTGFFETLFYVYLCLKVYYTFRDTTFSILANIVWEVIPFYIILRISVALLSVSRRNAQNITTAIANGKSI